MQAKDANDGQVIRWRRLAAVTVGIGAKDDPADRANKERRSECPEGQKQRGHWIVVREKHLRNIHREIAVDGDVVALQRVSDRGRHDEPGDACCDGPACDIAGNSTGGDSVIPNPFPFPFR